MSLTASNRIRKFLQAVRAVEPECSVQKLQILVEIMLQPGIDQNTLVRKVDQTRSAVSKNVADWTDITSKKKPGPGFVESRIDPMNRTGRLLYPTAKGKAVWQQIMESIT